MQPHHLAKFDTETNHTFLTEEVLYRRCPFGNKTPPYNLNDLFLDIRWDSDLVRGLSVNRSKFAYPNDAMWASISEDGEKRKCEYTQKTGVVYKSKTKTYPIEDPKTGIKIIILHSPINCNISHCDILTHHIPAVVNNAIKRDIKAFIATLFTELSEEDISSPTLVAQLLEPKEQNTERENEIAKASGCGLALLLVCFVFLYSV